MTGQGMTIGVLGHFGDTNHGDDACPRALLNNMSATLTDASFVLFCRYPKDAADRFGLPAYPVQRTPDRRPARPARRERQPTEKASRNRRQTGLRASLKALPGLRPTVRSLRRLVGVARILPAEAHIIFASYRRLRHVDLLIVTGSNPIFDYFGGFWNYPYTMWKWAILARIAGCKLAFASVGAGPIVSARSGRLLSKVLGKADLVSFRDRRSLDLLRSHGYRGHAGVYPDLAMSLPVPAAAERHTTMLRVGINPMPVHHPDYWPVSETRTQGSYIESLAALSIHLAHAGHDVFFYGTQSDDGVTASQVQEAMRRIDPTIPVPEFSRPETIDALTRLCLASDLLVTTRYHGAVFASLASRPTLTICYQGKTREVMEAAKLEKFAIDFEDVTPDLLIETFELLLRSRHEIQGTLEENASRARASLDELYSSLAALCRAEADPDARTYGSAPAAKT